MICIDRLEITDDAKYLIFSASIRDYLPDVKGAKIKCFSVSQSKDDESTFEEVFSFTFENKPESILVVLNSSVGCLTINGGIEADYTTDTELADKITTLSLKDHLIKVSIETEETDTEIPCHYKRCASGMIYYKGNLYSSMMPYVRELGNECKIPNGFIDQFLKYEALDNAILTGNEVQAIEYFNQWGKGSTNTYPVRRGCGCHG